jgi:hypothetical protein
MLKIERRRHLRVEVIRALIEIGDCSLDVTYSADVDLDGTFTATCNDTGETLSINGWLIDSIEEI